MKYWFFIYLAILLWFFFWLRPRVNDGRIEKIVDNFKGEYHWRYVFSAKFETFRCEAGAWYVYRRFMLKKYLKRKFQK